MKEKDASFLLREKILLMEIQRESEIILLKNQLRLTIESLKPLNLIKEVFTSTEMKTNVVDTALGMTSGYIIKKAIVRSSKNPFLKLLGTIIGMGAAKLVTKHPDGIKSIGAKIVSTVFKKEENTPGSYQGENE
jgi:hypothetical protein